MDKNLIEPKPIVDEKELKQLSAMTRKYEKLIEPGLAAKITSNFGNALPEPIKQLGGALGRTITEQELYEQIMRAATQGFQELQMRAARLSISEEEILKRANQLIPLGMTDIKELCFARCYDLSKLVTAYKTRDIVTAFAEGGTTGAAGFWGLPFNIVLSTFLYFRAVQSIAMFYGYDVKNDEAELVIANEVFTNALNPVSDFEGGQATNIISKFMVMGQAAVIKQAAKKGWSSMISRGGIPLLLAQMRALAHKSAKKALEKAGQKGLENCLFRESLEQVGRKLTLKTIGKAVPVASALISATLDTAQMNQVLNYADTFYQKRFISEKEFRIKQILNGEPYVEGQLI